ncbi:MAG: phosphoribosylaminoimidazolesuccinocarboxamide synthase [Gemmatimonadaceae bacterium]|nr:phosphoribosylaminoimidazolesuccinocarboxamide synthase [Gemmatimonadaceae bacterium]
MPVNRTSLPLPLLRRGKVRDVYEVDSERILIVASDRVSAFDVVMREAVPSKGAVLTQMTVWWLRQMEKEVPHHLLSANAAEIVNQIPALADHAETLGGRAMLCKRTQVFPVECVVRGYLAGSAWAEYKKTGTLAGELLPTGLTESAPLSPPIFSPATKADEGHDENITYARMSEHLGGAIADKLKSLSLSIYSRGREIAAEKGIIVADTKFEFGYLGADSNDPSGVILVDEVLTPDSSRFWPANSYAAGRSQPSFDKQPLRDYLAQEKAAGRWNGDDPPPELPTAVVSATSERYLDAFERITGLPLPMEFR